MSNLRKTIIGITLVFAILAAIIVLPAIFFVFGLPDFEPPPYSSDSFKKLADEIITQNKIFEMDDLSRTYKRINGVNVRLEKDPVDNSSGIFLDSLIDSLKIEKAVLEILRVQLLETKLREFFKSNDSILFRVDGIMGHSYGYFYCARGLGSDTIPFNFVGHEVSCYATVNAKWRKAMIRP